MEISCNVVACADVAPVPWKNGGGLTRELLAWPDPQQWLLRISVADIGASGPFSLFPGVDRWIAVLRGEGIRLATAGAPVVALSAAQSLLHAFPGDVRTDCTALGEGTRDFNVMLRRSAGRLTTHPLPQHPALDTTAALAALFVVSPLAVSAGPVAVWHVPGMALAWWPNPRHERRLLRNTILTPPVRGWWLELEI
jgi:environmental stress-induced protein Ves